MSTPYNSPASQGYPQQQASWMAWALAARLWHFNHGPVRMVVTFLVQLWDTELRLCPEEYRSQTELLRVYIFRKSTAMQIALRISENVHVHGCLDRMRWKHTPYIFMHVIEMARPIYQTMYSCGSADSIQRYALLRMGREQVRVLQSKCPKNDGQSLEIQSYKYQDIPKPVHTFVLYTLLRSKIPMHCHTSWALLPLDHHRRCRVWRPSPIKNW